MPFRAVMAGHVVAAGLAVAASGIVSHQIPSVADHFDNAGRSPAAAAVAGAGGGAGHDRGSAAGKDGAKTADKTTGNPVRRADANSRGPSYGVDLSDYDPNYPMAREVRSGRVSFVMTKATEGRGKVSRTFAPNWAEAKRLGVVRGAYHYAHPKNSPIAEADHFWSAVRQAGGIQRGDFLVLDIEETEGRSFDQISAWSKAFLDRVAQHTGSRTGLMVYAGRFFASRMHGLSSYPLWVAEYRSPTTPGRLGELPGQWGKGWVIHQFTEGRQPANMTPLAPAKLRSLGYRP